MSTLRHDTNQIGWNTQNPMMSAVSSLSYPALEVKIYLSRHWIVWARSDAVIPGVGYGVAATWLHDDREHLLCHGHPNPMSYGPVSTGSSIAQDLLSKAHSLQSVTGCSLPKFCCPNPTVQSPLSTTCFPQPIAHLPSCHLGMFSPFTIMAATANNVNTLVQ